MEGTGVHMIKVTKTVTNVSQYFRTKYIHLPHQTQSFNAFRREEGSLNKVLANVSVN